MVIYKVSVRDTERLEKQLKKAEEINSFLSSEEKHNSKVIYELLKHADRVLPSFATLTENEKQAITDTVAYLMRPDLIVHASEWVSNMPPLIHDSYLKTYGGDRLIVHLANNPAVLNPEWYLMQEEHKIPNFWQTQARSGEFYRCYFSIDCWMPRIHEKLCRDSHDPKYNLADVTAYLLDVNDLKECRYSKKEIEKYHKKVISQFKEEFSVSEPAN